MKNIINGVISNGINCIDNITDSLLNDLMGFNKHSNHKEDIKQTKLSQSATNAIDRLEGLEGLDPEDKQFVFKRSMYDAFCSLTGNAQTWEYTGSEADNIAPYFNDEFSLLSPQEKRKALELPTNDDGYVIDINGNIVHYANSPSLSYQNAQLPLTEQHSIEIAKCFQNPFYFIESYTQIFTLDDGWVFPTLRLYQKRTIMHFVQNRFSNMMAGRQCGKSVTTLLFILWKMIFFPGTIVGIAANKEAMATENITRLREYYERLPLWLKSGVVRWKETSFSLENGSKCYSEATSPTTFRGKGISLLFVDEVAFIECWDEFTKSVFQTVSSGKSSQAIYTSTPKGLNHWYHQWTKAEEGQSLFRNVKVDWWEVPGRDEEWRLETISTLPGGEREFAQEFACEFLGSAKTLVDISVLKMFRYKDPICYDLFIRGTKQYFAPIEGHKYVLAADAAKDGMDDYVIQIIDITKFPFKQVLSGRFNTSHLNMPEVINNLGLHYNTAFVIIENNEGGGQSNVDTLRNVYEYENVFKENKSYYGFRTTAKNRPKILSIMKMFINNGNLLIYDKDTINQLFSFVEINGKFQADKGSKDDLVMALAISFAPYINITNIEDYKEFLKVLEANRLETEKEEEETVGILNIGYFDDGISIQGFGGNVGGFGGGFDGGFGGGFDGGFGGGFDGGQFGGQFDNQNKDNIQLIYGGFTNF